MKIAQLAVLMCLTGATLGCGQKGPLVLPDAAPKHKRVIPAPPAAKPAPAGQGTTSPAPSAPTTAPAPAPSTPAPPSTQAPGPTTPQS